MQILSKLENRFVIQLKGLVLALVDNSVSKISDELWLGVT